MPFNIFAQTGAKIRLLRKQQGLSYRVMEDKSNVSRSYLLDMEKGQVNPTLGKLDDIARALGVTVSELTRPDRPDLF